MIQNEDSSLLSRSVDQSYGRRSSSGGCSRCCKARCVPFKETILVLVWSALLHSFLYFLQVASPLVDITLIGIFIDESFFIISMLTAMIVILLLYPVAGLLAEVRFTRFKFMICGTAVVIGGQIITAAISYTKVQLFNHTFISEMVSLALVAGVTITNIGLGMFEANAIQFGVDQLQFASNEELSIFVHWYFWTLFAVQYTCTLVTLPAYYVTTTSTSSSFSKPMLYMTHSMTYTLPLICSILALALVIYCNCRHHLFIIEPTTRNNPLKLIVKVMNYARQHSQPVRRSAFTYGEALPTRLDLAKERYGGTFTTEQVEDVKSFWRMTGLLLTLFGLLLFTGPMEESFIYNSDDAADVRIISYSQTLYFTVIIIGIPFYMCMRPCLRRHLPSMLKKMGIGLLMICIALTLTTVSSAMAYEYKAYNSTCNMMLEYRWNNNERIIAFGSIFIAQLFNCVGYILVFLTVLEFILAQAPRNMQGLLIGLWYAYQSIGLAIRLVIAIVETQHCHYWPYIVKTVFAVISFLLYLFVSRHFKYRQREESSNTNYRSIIEEYTHRQLERKEEASRDISSIEEDVIIED